MVATTSASRLRRLRRAFWDDAWCVAGSLIVMGNILAEAMRMVQSLWREAVYLTVASGGNYAFVVADRDPNRVSGRLGQRVAVEGVAVARIEDQQRQPGRAVPGRGADHDIAGTSAGQARRRQRADVVAAPDLLAVITRVFERDQASVGAAAGHDQSARRHRRRRLSQELQRRRPFRLPVGGIQPP